MNNETIKSIFTFISNLKNIKKQKLLIDINDEDIMIKNYKKLGKCKTSYFTYRKKVFQYAINNMADIETSCKEVEKIFNTNGR